MDPSRITGETRTDVQERALVMINRRAARGTISLRGEYAALVIELCPSR
jgi:hypothetical protein